ncbi:MAG TPA: LysM domain-containing protein [Acidimicrobiales bacterium]
MSAAPPTGATGIAGWRGVAVLAAWTAGLLVVVRLLLAARSRSLAVPLTSLDELPAWVSETPPTDMAVEVLRLGAIAAAVYLLAVTVLATAARLLRLRVAAELVDNISPGAVRRVVARGSGLGLAVGGIVGGLPAPSLPPPSAVATTATATTAPPPTADREGRSTATMARVPDAPTAGAAPGSATMVRLGADAADPGTTTVPPVEPRVGERPHPGGRDPAVPPLAPPPTPPPPAVDPGTWVVEPGDSFWSIALEVTAAADGSPADERTVTRCWQRLVEVNRSRLADRGNPDLLVPGQRLAVPPPGG